MRCATICSADHALRRTGMQSPHRILVVEDSPLIRRRLLDALARLGDFDVLGSAESAQEAVDAIGRLQPEIVITDIRLKEGNGIDVVRHIRAHPYDPRPRIYVLTNYAYPEYKRECALIGADDFFDKSTEYDRLLATLRDVV
jgi:DNA-binding NarL/FixJ family response regulator